MSGLSRDKFEALWEHFHRDAVESKELNESSVRLAKFYEGLSAFEKSIVNSILADWILSDDYGRRFDALALVNEFKIRSCLDAVCEQLRQLESVGGPSATYDRAKLERIISRLEE